MPFFQGFSPAFARSYPPFVTAFADFGDRSPLRGFTASEKLVPLSPTENTAYEPNAPYH